MYRTCRMVLALVLTFSITIPIFAQQDSLPKSVPTVPSKEKPSSGLSSRGVESVASGAAENTALRERVDALEKKLELMEQLLFKTVRLEQLEATERLRQAQAALENSRKLQLRGIITPAEVQLDFYQLEMAKLQLQLTAAECDYREVSTHIDLVAARSELLRAQQRLRQYELQFPRGIISPDVLKRQQQVVEDRERAVDFQQERLEAVRQMVEGSESGRIGEPAAGETREDGGKIPSNSEAPPVDPGKVDSDNLKPAGDQS